MTVLTVARGFAFLICLLVYVEWHIWILQTHTQLQNKLDSVESDLEATKAAQKLHEQEESSWRKTRKTLESDLDTAEAQLDKTKVKLDTEKKARYVYWGGVYLLSNLDNKYT